jgi:16S rRNA (adenine(1408)-N(1))-methyltransferase
VIDIGTGDGRFVLAAARADPSTFFIGIDANTKPLEKPSMRATRKLNKGGLPNVLFVQAAVEDLPDEFAAVADEIHIHFPWGSLLRAVAAPDTGVLAAIRRLAAPECRLELILGIHPERDQAELKRLGLTVLTDPDHKSRLVTDYSRAGFQLIDAGSLTAEECRSLDSMWAKRLSTSKDRSVDFMVFRAV